MTIDENLTFDSHVAKVCRKVHQCTGLLWRVRSFISRDLAKYLYTSLIAPHFAYLDHIYDGCNATSSKRLQATQNNALRAILKVEARYPTTALHEETGIDYLAQIRMRSTCIEVYKSIHNMNPANVSDMFIPKAPQRVLRSNEQVIMEIPKMKLKMSDQNIVVRGSKYWALLPSNIQHAGSLAEFKAKIRTHNVGNHYPWM